MSRAVDDVRIREIKELSPPAHLLREFPLSPAAEEVVYATRQAIHRILHGADDRMLVVIGPCSVHDVRAAKDYAARLLDAKRPHDGELVIVMRVYFEKPRTTVGWKGLINDPNLDGSFQINKGLRIARELLLDLTEMGMPAGTEYLDTQTPQYLGDLVGWSAIGARTTESQVHRQLASGLSCAVGFKNGTDGNIRIAVDAIKAASSPHHFLSITKGGHSAIVSTNGNEDCHVILRGGKEPNYDAASVEAACRALGAAGLAQRVMIDFSHAQQQQGLQTPGSGGRRRRRAGGRRRRRGIFGVMIESHLVAGRQDLVPGRELALRPEHHRRLPRLGRERSAAGAPGRSGARAPPQALGRVGQGRVRARLPAALSATAAQRGFLIAVAVTLAFRLWLAAWLPLTGDEAYFAFWGEVPAAGYYDHPPMVGWLLAALLQVSDAAWWLRLPQILLPAGVAAVMARLLAPAVGPVPAYLAAGAFLVAPVQVLNVAVTTDTPLVAFSFLSVAAFYLAVRRDSLAWSAVAGLMLGLAILSKFFAAPLAAAYLAYVLVTPSWRRRWSALALIVAASAPFALYLAWWNYQHCWANVMFNLYIRHGDAGIDWVKPLKFAGFPHLRDQSAAPVAARAAAEAIRVSLRVPPVRLLWMACAVPLATLRRAVRRQERRPALAVRLRAAAVRRRRVRARPHATARRRVVSGCDLGAARGGRRVRRGPADRTFSRLRQYDGVVMTFATQELLAKLAQFEGDYVLMADGYSPAVTLGIGAARRRFRAAAPDAGVPPHYVGCSARRRHARGRTIS